MKINFYEYNSVEDYQFDYGFNIDDEAVKDLEGSEENKLFSSCDTIMIKNHKGKLLVYGRYSGFFVSVDKDLKIPSGKYIIKFDRRGNKIDDVNVFSHEIIGKDELGEDLYNLILNEVECFTLQEKLQEYQKNQSWDRLQQTHKYFAHYYFDDWQQKYSDKSHDEIIEGIEAEHHKVVDERIDEELKSREEKKARESEQEIIDNNITNDLDFEIAKDEKVLKYTVKDSTVLINDSNNKPHIKLKFKSHEYFKDKMSQRLYALKNINYIGDVKCSLADAEISFEYSEFEADGFGGGVYNPIAELDFERCLFNGFKVAKAKLKFFFNRIDNDKKRASIYRNKTNVELVNRLSGIKVDILNLDRVKVYGTKLEFDIKFTIHDRETYIVEFMGLEKTVDWKIIKETLTMGSRAIQSIGKKDLLKFAKQLEIPNETIEQNIRKLKVFTKLKGSNENGN